MKYKIRTTVFIVIVLLSALLLSRDDNSLLNRTHQHLEYKEKAIQENSSNEFSTHLPIIKINMDGYEPQVYDITYKNGQSDLVSSEISGVVEVIDNDDRYNLISDQPSLQVPSYVRIRGNSSKLHHKKNYQLNFVYEDGTENKEYGLLGMEPHDEWALHGPYLDRTMIRNYMCMNVTGQIMPYTPDVRFCELFVNDEYRGLYLAMETVAKGEGRVDIRTYDDGKDISSYLLQVNWFSNSSNNIDPFTIYTKMIGPSIATSIEYPSENITSGLQEYIEQQISDYEKALYSFDYDTQTYGYRSFLDVDSFVDYAIINEFFQNYDAGDISTFFYKDLGGKLHIGPVWDFNNSLDNFPEILPDFGVVHSVRYNMLIKDEYFVEKLIKRYRALRETALSEEYLLNYIDETVSFLGPAVDRNFEVWDGTFDYEIMQGEIRLEHEWRNPESYEESVEFLKEYIRKRGSWLDEHIDTLRQFCHESATKKYNH